MSIVIIFMSISIKRRKKMLFFKNVMNLSRRNKKKRGYSIFLSSLVFSFTPVKLLFSGFPCVFRSGS